MSTYTRVTKFQKTVRFFGPPCRVVTASSIRHSGETEAAITVADGPAGQAY